MAGTTTLYFEISNVGGQRFWERISARHEFFHGNTLGKTVKAKKSTQKELAADLGVSEKTVSDWSNGGKISDPRKILAIPVALGMTVAEANKFLWHIAHRGQLDPKNPEDEVCRKLLSNPGYYQEVAPRQKGETVPDWMRRLERNYGLGKAMIDEEEEARQEILANRAHYLQLFPRKPQESDPAWLERLVKEGKINTSRFQMVAHKRIIAFVENYVKNSMVEEFVNRNHQAYAFDMDSYLHERPEYALQVTGVRENLALTEEEKNDKITELLKESWFDQDPFLEEQGSEWKELRAKLDEKPEKVRRGDLIRLALRLRMNYPTANQLLVESGHGQLYAKDIFEAALISVWSELSQSRGAEFGLSTIEGRSAGKQIESWTPTGIQREDEGEPEEEEGPEILDMQLHICEEINRRLSGSGKGQNQFSKELKNPPSWHLPPEACLVRYRAVRGTYIYYCVDEDSKRTEKLTIPVPEGATEKEKEEAARIVAKREGKRLVKRNNVWQYYVSKPGKDLIKVINNMLKNNDYPPVGAGIFRSADVKMKEYLEKFDRPLTRGELIDFWFLINKHYGFLNATPDKVVKSGKNSEQRQKEQL